MLTALQPTAPNPLEASVGALPAAQTRPVGLAFGPYQVDLAAQRLLLDGKPVPLRPRYFDVLVFLAGSGGRLVTKEELLDAVWGHRHVSDSVLKVAINALRVALHDDAKSPRYLETVQRRGYRFLGAHAVGADAEPRATPAASPAASPAKEAVPERWAPAAAPAQAVARPHGNLPGLAAEMVGRDAELRQLLAALSAHRLVTLHGAAGAGKTRLALAAAHRKTEADGVWLLRLDALADASLLLHTVARTLGLGAGADADADALARALAPSKALLVLDNAEHIVQAVADLAAAVLQRAPGVRLLVTSQVPLKLGGEQVLPLGPLPLPAEGDRSLDAASVQLLWLRVRQRHEGLQWDDLAAAHAGAICRMLDGLPLALELAAARVPVLGWAGVHQRLGERMSLLTRGERDAPQRQRSLRAALAWSCSLLAPASLRLLQHLSVFSGSFTLQGAAQVSGIEDEAELLDGVDDLLQHALITGADAGATPRWRLFDSVRHFAALGLKNEGGDGAALRRLLVHLADVFDQADRDFAEIYQRAWVLGLLAEADNLRGALNAAFAMPALRLEAARLFCSSAQFRARAIWRSELRRDHAVIATWSRDDWPESLRAAYDLALAYMGALAQVLPPATALAGARRARAYLENTPDRWALYSALGLGAGLLLRVGAPHSERQAVVQRMLAMHDDTWSPARRRNGNWQALQLLRLPGNEAVYEAAATTFLATARALGDDYGSWIAAQVLAQSQASQGQFDNAMALLERTVTDMRAAGELRQHTTVLAQCALLRLTRGVEPSTLALLQEALQALSAEGMLWWLADALAWVPAHRGQWPVALRLQAWADHLVQQRGEQRGPLFTAVRRRWDQLLDQQPEAAAWRACWPAGTDLDETLALALAFGTH